MLPLHQAEPRQGRGSSKGEAGDDSTCWGRGTTGTHQPGCPACSWLPSYASPAVLLVFLSICKRKRGPRKMSDQRDQDALRARQLLMCEETSPRNKVASAPSLIRLMGVRLTQCLSRDRHCAGHWGSRSPSPGALTVLGEMHMIKRAEMLHKNAQAPCQPQLLLCFSLGASQNTHTHAHTRACIHAHTHTHTVPHSRIFVSTSRNLNLR